MEISNVTTIALGRAVVWRTFFQWCALFIPATLYWEATVQNFDTPLALRHVISPFNPLLLCVISLAMTDSLVSFIHRPIFS